MRKAKEVFKMNTQTVVQKAQKELKNSMNLGNLPEKKFRAGAVSATVWLNKSNKHEIF